MTDDFTRANAACYFAVTNEIIHQLYGLMKDEGREAYVSEIAGRFVIPVTPTYKRTVGIVHDSSRTGKTLYVEPTQVCVPLPYLFRNRTCTYVCVCVLLYHQVGHPVGLIMQKDGEALGRLTRCVRVFLCGVRGELRVS